MMFPCYILLAGTILLLLTRLSQGHCSVLVGMLFRPLKIHSSNTSENTQLCKSTEVCIILKFLPKYPQGHLASNKHEILNVQSNTHGVALLNILTLKIWPFLLVLFCPAFQSKDLCIPTILSTIYLNQVGLDLSNSEGNEPGKLFFPL